MGKQSTRENKTIYQLCRESAGLTRAEASEKMTAVSDSKIEKFEYETQEPTPYDILQMADAYKRPDLCNYYCSHKCEIGQRYVPEIEVTNLSNIILETIASLNEINPLTGRLIQIARDGKISDDEMKDFAYISKKLDEISLAIDSLNLWVDKTAGAAGLCAYTFYRSVLAFLFLLPVAFLYPVYKKKDLKKERIRRLTLQFKEGIMVLASFLSAGYSLENSLSLSVKELEGLYGKTGMITEEFSYMEAGVRMNRPVELLLADMGRRSGIQDVDQFAQVFAAAKRSGGELTDIINQTAGIIRDKIQVQEEIHTLTAARVFEQKIMNGIPFGIILYIDFTSPGFFHVMYETWLGRIFMTACLGIYVGAVFLAKKILDIPL